MADCIGITGSTGVLGRILLNKLKERKINYSCFAGDISSEKDVKEWINSNSFSEIIHLAAVVSTKEVDKDLKRAYNVNVLGTKNLIEELIKLEKKPWLFYASTSHIYKSKKKPILEEDEKEPISEYGMTKYLAEKEIINNYDNFCIGRIFSFYHTTQKKPFLYPSILERLEKEDLNKTFELFGAESIRDFLDAEKVVEIILVLMGGNVKGIYNIASGKPTKIKEFVQNMAPHELKIISKGDPDYLVAEISKLNKVLNE